MITLEGVLALVFGVAMVGFVLWLLGNLGTRQGMMLARFSGIFTGCCLLLALACNTPPPTLPLTLLQRSRELFAQHSPLQRRRRRRISTQP